MPTFGAGLAGALQIVESTAAGAVRILVVVAPGVAFHIIVHILGKPFATFHLDRAVDLTVARVLDHPRHIAERCTVFLFGLAVFHHLFTLVLFAAFQGVHPRFLSLGIRKLDAQVTHGEEFIATGKVDTRNIDNQFFSTEITRLVEVGNPSFHGFVTLFVEMFLLDLGGRNGHVTRNREHEQTVFHLEGYRLNFLIVRIFTETDVAFNLGGGVIAFAFGIVNGIPSLLGSGKRLDRKHTTDQGKQGL